MMDLRLLQQELPESATAHDIVLLSILYGVFLYVELGEPPLKGILDLDRLDLM